MNFCAQTCFPCFMLEKFMFACDLVHQITYLKTSIIFHVLSSPPPCHFQVLILKSKSAPKRGLTRHIKVFVYAINLFDLLSVYRELTFRLLLVNYFSSAGFKAFFSLCILIRFKMNFFTIF